MPKKYRKKCDFICSKQSNWTKYTITLKHNNETNETILKQNTLGVFYVTLIYTSDG